MRARYECPFTGKGTSIAGPHESCGNRCHDASPCCMTCCRNCMTICMVDVHNPDDRESIAKEVIVR